MDGVRQGLGRGAVVDKHRSDKGREAMQAREEQARGGRQAEGRAKEGAGGGSAVALINKRLARLARLAPGRSWKAHMGAKAAKNATP